MEMQGKYENMKDEKKSEVYEKDDNDKGNKEMDR